MSALPHAWLQVPPNTPPAEAAAAKFAEQASGWVWVGLLGLDVDAVGRQRQPMP